MRERERERGGGLIVKVPAKYSRILIVPSLIHLLFSQSPPTMCDIP